MERNEEVVSSDHENFTTTLRASLSRPLKNSNNFKEPRGKGCLPGEGAQPASKSNVRARHEREALLDALVSTVPKNIIRVFLVDDPKIGDGKDRVTANDSGSSSTLGQRNRKQAEDAASRRLDGLSDGCDYEKPASGRSTCRARAADSRPTIKQANLKPRQNYNVRIPYSNRVVTLQNGPADAYSKSSPPRKVLRTGIAVPGDAGSRSCFSFIHPKLFLCKHRDALPESHICGQLLREVASRIQTIVSNSEYSLMLSTRDAGTINKDEISPVYSRAEVIKLSELYARLLLFDQHLLLPSSQWWRFQKCEGDDEHASQQLAVKPFFTVLHVVPRLRNVSYLRPSIPSCRVRPHIKVTLDLMHVCLTAHYLFGEEDVLAQELLRMYEVYCFLKNTRSGEQLTPRLRSSIQYTEEVRKKLGFPCLSPLVAVASGHPVTSSMNEELRQAEHLLNDIRREYPQRWTQWIQHLQCRRQLRLQRDGEALLFKKCEQELEMKWLQIVRLRRLKGYSQNNLMMKVVYIHSDAQNDVDTVQLEILAEAEELFYYYVDKADKRSSLSVAEESPAGEVQEDSDSPKPLHQTWSFDLKEFVEAISFKFHMQERRQPGQPFRRLLLTQMPNSVEQLQVTPPAEQGRRLLASSLLSSVSCKVNGRALSRRAHIPLNVPSFASSPHHLLPLWDVNSSVTTGAALAGSVPEEPQKRAVHTFGTVLAEPLTDISFDVELHHAGLDIPRVATTRVPIAPELSLLTEGVPDVTEVEKTTKDILRPAMVGVPPPVLSHPVSIDVDVPFSYSCAQDYGQDIRGPGSDGKTASKHNDRASHRTNRKQEGFQDKTTDDDDISAEGPGRSNLHGDATQKSRLFSDDRATRVTQDRMRLLKTAAAPGQRNLFLLEQTELRLKAAEWDQENAAAAEAEALDMAAAFAAEAKAEAFTRDAMVHAAAEATRDVANVQKEGGKAQQHKLKFGWHDWKAFRLRGGNMNQQGGAAGSNTRPKVASMSYNGVIATDAAKDIIPAQGVRRLKDQSPSKRRSIAEEEQIEVEQEARLLARASVLSLCKTTHGVPQALAHIPIPHEKGQQILSATSIDGQQEADTAESRKEESLRKAHSSTNKRKKRLKAKDAEKPGAQSRDKRADEATLPTFAVNGKHSSAPHDKIEFSFSSTDDQYGIVTLRPGEQHNATSTCAISAAPGAFQKACFADAHFPEESSHIRAYSSTGNLLPPPPVRVRRPVRTTESSASVPPRLKGVYNFCRQQEKDSEGRASLPFSQLPASMWTGDLTKQSSMLDKWGPTNRCQPELVPTYEPAWDSAGPEWAGTAQFSTRNVEVTSVLAHPWMEGIPIRPPAGVSPTVLQLPAVTIEHGCLTFHYLAWHQRTETECPVTVQPAVDV